MIKVILIIVLLAIAALLWYLFQPSKKQDPELEPEAQELFDYWTGKKDYIEIDGQVIGPPDAKKAENNGMDPKSRIMPPIIPEEKPPEKEKKNLPDFKYVPHNPPRSLKPEEKDKEKKKDHDHGRI